MENTNPRPMMSIVQLFCKLSAETEQTLQTKYFHDRVSKYEVKQYSLMLAISECDGFPLNFNHSKLDRSSSIQHFNSDLLSSDIQRLTV